MNKSLWIMLATLVALPIAAHAAEVYKWVDKDGVTRYSDSPPPSNVKQLPVNGKKPAGTPPVSAMTVEDAAAAAAAESAPVAPPAAAASTDAKKKPAAKPDEDAAKRQKDAEEEKKKNDQKEAELKQKQESCSNAKSNYHTYQQGGRIRKNNESGDRSYLSDAEIAQGLAQAQKDMEQFCNGT